MYLRTKTWIRRVNLLLRTSLWATSLRNLPRNALRRLSNNPLNFLIRSVLTALLPPLLLTLRTLRWKPLPRLQPLKPSIPIIVIARIIIIVGSRPYLRRRRRSRGSKIRKGFFLEILRPDQLINESLKKSKNAKKNQCPCRCQCSRGDHTTRRFTREQLIEIRREMMIQIEISIISSSIHIH